MPIKHRIPAYSSAWHEHCNRASGVNSAPHGRRVKDAKTANLFMLRLILISCVALASPWSVAPEHDLTRKQRIAAKKIYDSKCAKCHRFYEPKDYSEDEWRLWMAKMSKKAKLNPGQDRLLNRYLDSFRAQNPAPTLSGKASNNQAGSVTEANRQHSDPANQSKPGR